MTRKAVRGLFSKDEQAPGLLIRDTRPILRRIADFFSNAMAMAVMLLALAVTCFFESQLVDIILLFAIICYIMPICKRTVLPFRLPKRSGKLDSNDLVPGGTKPRKARGIYFFGNSVEDDEELWFSNEDMRTHILIFGSTGSGKTEFLISLAYNALLQSSGFIYVDGKGDNSLFAKVFAMIRYMGREDDLLLINFMTGARDIVGPQKRRLSNTLNPFSSGSSSMLAQLVISMMGESSSSSDGDMWKGRAIAFVEALMKSLVCMRDMGHILLDAHVVRRYFTLERIEAIVLDKVFIRDGQQPISMENVPETVIQPLASYLETLPGYQKARRGKQVSQVFEQHGFIVMQLVRVFTSLADTYGHILRTKLAEVDLKDVVLNRRIFVALLPALEKSPDELSNLGKIIIAALKTMMAAGLGDEVEGEYHDLVKRKPTNALTPFLCILDEYGYYAVQGFAVVPAQARSLGFSVVFAGQDLPAFQKSSKEEAASIGANTNIKICMKLEDPTETWEFFMKTAGEAYVAQVSGFQANAGNVSNTYLDTRGASLEKRARVNLLDLKDQREGEAHIFFKSQIVRSRLFYANPPEVKRLRLNQFIKVDIPPDNELYVIAKGFEDFEELAKNPPSVLEPEGNKVLEQVLKVMNNNPSVAPIEKGVSVLLSFHTESQYQVKQGAIEVAENELHIFIAVSISAALQTMIMGESAQFEQPMLSEANALSQIDYLCCLMDCSEKQANRIATDIVSDMRNMSRYPPEVKETMHGGKLAELTYTLCDAIDLRREEKRKEDQEKKDDKKE